MAMTDRIRTLPFGAITVHRIVSALWSLIERYESWLAHRETVAQLRRLDARELEDIGLTPGDLDRLEEEGRF